MVGAQGTVVDRIDYNIQTVGSQVDKGVKQLAKVTTPKICHEKGRGEWFGQV